MLLIAFATIADVLSRALFSRAITGMEEVAGMALAVAVSACLPAGAAQRVNITVDLLSGHISRAMQVRLERFGALALLVLYALLALRVGGYAAELGARDAVTVYVRVPIAPFLWVVSAFLAASALVQGLVVFTQVERWATGIALLVAAALALVALHFALPTLSALARAGPGWTSALIVLGVWLLLAASVPLAAALGLLGVL